MLMTSILLQKRERPSEAAPVFISRIPSRSHPETIPKDCRLGFGPRQREQAGLFPPSDPFLCPSCPFFLSFQPYI